MGPRAARVTPLLCLWRPPDSTDDEEAVEVVLISVIPTLNGYSTEGVIVRGDGSFTFTSMDRLTVVRTLAGFRPRGDSIVAS